MKRKDAGFQEIEHTADWALQVWAPDLPILFTLAAEGMNSLAEVKLAEGEREYHRIEIEEADIETLLVSFLSELLYYSEDEGIGFDHFKISINGDRLEAAVEGGAILSIKKEIKAVTYHNLEVRQTDLGYQVVIVFDV